MAAANGRSPVARACSSANPIPKALLAWVPERIGYVAAGNHACQLDRTAATAGATAAVHPAAS